MSITLESAKVIDSGALSVFNLEKLRQLESDLIESIIIHNDELETAETRHEQQTIYNCIKRDEIRLEKVRAEIERQYEMVLI